MARVAPNQGIGAHQLRALAALREQQQSHGPGEAGDDQGRLENFRTGRRARKMHGEGGRKTKLRKRDRKSTYLLELPVHPALMEAYKGLLGPEGGGTAAKGP